jgi:HEAT repeats
MTLDESRLLIPQYLSGGLTSAEQVAFEDSLANNAGLRLELEELRNLWTGLSLLPDEQPSAALRARFYQKLNRLEKTGQTSIVERVAGWKFWPQVAFGLLLFLAGAYLGRMKTAERVNADQLAQMNSQVQGLREMVALSLLDRQSATSRLEGVAWSSQVERPNDQLLSALVLALNHDANVNVRLSSLDALERFTHNAAVGKALIDSIQRQDSPLVQIALIDALVHVRNQGAAPELKKLTVDAELNPAVRQRAAWGLQKLSFE